MLIVNPEDSNKASGKGTILLYSLTPDIAWIEDAKNKLRELNFTGVVIYPCHNTEGRQCCTQVEAGSTADCILIWLPKNTNNPTIVSALISLNWIYRGLIVLGWSYCIANPRYTYLSIFAQTQKIPNFRTLNTTIKGAIKMATKKPA
jgi:hypothetical protein